MSSIPAPPKPAPHHAYKSWSTSWYDEQGKRHWKRFGKCTEMKKPAAMVAYQSWMETEWKQSAAVRDGSAKFTVKKLCALYAEFCRKRYVKGGKLTSHIDQIEAALNAMIVKLGDRPTDSIGAPEITRLRDEMVYTKDRHGQPTTLTANTINSRLRIIKQAFRWGRGQGLVDRYAALDVAMTQPIDANRGDVKPSRKVLPVPQDILARTLEHCPQTIRDMIQIQLLTGMRPGELCSMRPCDIKVDGDKWVYRPETHKTQHKGKTRAIFVAARAQAILRGYIAKRKINEPVFMPTDSHRERLEMRGMPKVAAYQLSRSRFKPARNFRADTYRNRIDQACDHAFDQDGTKRKARDYSHRWHPNRLRHNFATMVREVAGIEAASALLGHSSINVTEIYAEKSEKLAWEAVRRVG